MDGDVAVESDVSWQCKNCFSTNPFEVANCRKCNLRKGGVPSFYFRPPEIQVRYGYISTSEMKKREAEMNTSQAEVETEVPVLREVSPLSVKVCILCGKSYRMGVRCPVHGGVYLEMTPEKYREYRANHSDSERRGLSGEAGAVEHFGKSVRPGELA